MLIKEIAQYRKITPRVRGKIAEPIQTAYQAHLATTPRNANSFDDRKPDQNFLEELKRLGWTPLDSGLFSDVYSNPKKSYVIKVNEKPDLGYEKFVQLIKKYPNRHFPKISDVKVVAQGNARYYIYAIEKLQPIEPISWRETLTGWIDEYSWDWLQGRTPKFSQEAADYFKQNPRLAEAVKIIGIHGGNATDIHEGNIMQRRDGTVVIIDPYVG